MDGVRGDVSDQAVANYGGDGAVNLADDWFDQLNQEFMAHSDLAVKYSSDPGKLGRCYHLSILHWLKSSLR